MSHSSDVHSVDQRRLRLKRDLSKVFRVPYLSQALPLASQPERMPEGVIMFDHQRRALARMQSIESNLVGRSITLPGLNTSIRTRGGVLCDKVGFGKTMDVLALIDSSNSAECEGEGGESRLWNLVITPDHLIDQWETECAKFFPHLRYIVFSDSTFCAHVVTGSARPRYGDGQWELDLSRCGFQETGSSASNQEVKDDPYNIVFITLSCFSRAAPICHRFSRVFLDECHDVVLLSSHVTERMSKLNSPIFWCITGTPFPRADDSVYGINKGVYP